MGKSVVLYLGGPFESWGAFKNTGAWALPPEILIYLSQGVLGVFLSSKRQPRFRTIGIKDENFQTLPENKTNYYEENETPNKEES